MKTSSALILGVFAVCLPASPAIFAQRLYPVLGPAAAQVPPPSFTAKLTAIYKSSGKISLSQAGGESFQGTWSIVTASFVNGKAPGSAASYPPQPNLAFAWDLVYGQGYYVAKILGSQSIGQASATGSQGTLLQIEFNRYQLGMMVDNTFGVAIDNKGNIYKVVL